MTRFLDLGCLSELHNRSESAAIDALMAVGCRGPDGAPGERDGSIEIDAQISGQSEGRGACPRRDFISFAQRPDGRPWLGKKQPYRRSG